MENTVRNEAKETDGEYKDLSLGGKTRNYDINEEVIGACMGKP